MAADCNNKNPLQRSGTSQYQRVLEALLPSYAQVDERDYADLILFARNYAACLNYYNALNKADGDWTSLMKMDVSVTLAAQVKQNAVKYFSYITWLSEFINAFDGLGTNIIKDHYKFIYDFLYTLIYDLDRQHGSLPEDFEFTQYLGNTIRSRLAELAKRLDAWYEGSVTEGLLDAAGTARSIKAPVPVKLTQELKKQALSSIWAAGTSFVPEYHGSSVASKIKNVVNHNMFKGVVENILKSLSQIIETARQYLDQTLTDFPTHTPHYALYLTFLRLFRVAQNDLNTYSERHLQFYYREVLRLMPRPAVPDEVHLVFELARNVNSHLLPADTIFKGGKNADGLEMYYGLTDDIVVNTGKVKTIRAIYKEEKTSADGNYQNVYSAPVANSADGKGADLGEGKAWETFGDPGKNDMAVTGFAIAHSLLYLKEGERRVEIFIQCAGLKELLNAEAIDIMANLKVELTGAEGWYEVELETGALVGVVWVFENLAIFQFEMGAEAPAIIPYSEEIHGGGFETGLPVIRFTMVNTKGQFNAGKIMSAVSLGTVNLFVSVSGMKSVSIQNEVSVLDPAKPFQIFGPQPHVGSSFIIGSKEIMLKNRQNEVSVNLDIEWDNIDRLETGKGDGNQYYYTGDNDGGNDPDGGKKILAGYLKNGNWVMDTASQEIFKHVHQTVGGKTYHCPISNTLNITIPVFDTDFDFSEDEVYNIQSRNGFAKLEFRGLIDFGHSDYVRRLMQQAVKGASAVIPPEPYTPTVKSLTVRYTAQASFDMADATAGSVNDTRGRFYHIHPFGHAEQHRAFLGAGTNIPLIPRFSNEGELFVGLEKFAASQSVNILFQVSEGSADPTRDRQNLVWHYLAASNIWKPFDTRSLVDETNDLTRSGIIKFPFPADAVAANTLMGEQLFWIRGVVQQDSAAVCDMVALHAQAAKAQLTDYAASGLEFKSLLPASTISKLLKSDSAVKKIEQPYASFNGKARETDPQFYTHTSERLRHKKRSITMWDYERMVLEQFPQIYKVKCLNHTAVRMGGATPEKDNELAPGHVVVVTLPDLQNRNAFNPLRPQTSLGTLVEVAEFLKQHISPWVKIQVKNARFEEIQLDFRVKFMNDDTAYYHDVLIGELEEFLSPWAYGGTRDIEFGGRMQRSVLLNFVEERPYVDYVTCFKMYHIVDGVKSADVEEAEATSARSIFVSYAGKTDDAGNITDPKHIIDYVNVDCNCS